MSILKTILIIALVAASASAGRNGRQRQRQQGRGLNQRGRQFAVSEAAATPEAAESQADLGETLAIAQQQTDAVAAPETLSAPEAQAAGEALVENIAEASAIAAEAPQAQEVQPEVIAAKIEETHDDLEANLNLAKKHQKQLQKYGSTMTPEQVVQHQVALHKHLELALHFAQQHNAAVQQDKAIEAGASPVEVAAIAPEVIATGRSMRG